MKYGAVWIAALLSLVLKLIAVKILIPILKRQHIGQSIKRDGPIWHLSKEGTPTMGGIMFIVGILVSVLAAVLMDQTLRSALVPFAFALLQGAIGVLDDCKKLQHKKNEGLKGREKLLIQLVVSVAFVLLMRYLGCLSPNLYIPFVGSSIPLSEPLYAAFCAFVIVGTVNAVNLTDGADGLVSGVSLPPVLGMAALALHWGMKAQGLYALLVAAGILGFLCYNHYPAKVFMGDTGSLFLGGSICAIAFALDMPLALIPFGIIYILEALSDIIQVLYFKLTHGKRFFRMAPIHHHFEKGGWSEWKVFSVFSGVSLLFAIVTCLCLWSRYGL